MSQQTTQFESEQGVQYPQQFGTRHQPTQQDAGRLPQQSREVLSAVGQAVQVCGWCADQCTQLADQQMVECVRRCEDVVELGETLLALAPRSSAFTADIARTFERATRACAQECGQHSQSHCQECAAVLSQTGQAVRKLSAGQQPQIGQQF